VARILRFIDAGSRAPPPPRFAEPSASLLELLDSSLEDVLCETPGASGRESIAFVVAGGRGCVCASEMRPIEANNAIVVKIRLLLRSFLEVSRTRAIVKNYSLTG